MFWPQTRTNYALVMKKHSQLALIAVAGFVSLSPGFAGAGVLGPDAPQCAAGDGPAMLVRVDGLKDRDGTVRVRSFGGSPDNYFDKKRAMRRIVVPIPAAGSLDVCLPVSAPGVYAVDVRHDANGNGKTDRADGAGASGNPKVTLFDILFKRKPPARQVQVAVGQGVTVVPVVIKYLSGGSLKPITMASKPAKMASR